MSRRLSDPWNRVWHLGPDEMPPPDSWAAMHQLIREAFGIWRRASPPGGLPGRAQLGPEVLGTRLLPHVMLMDVDRGEDGERIYRYRLVGTNLVRYIGQEITGRFLHEFQGADRSELNAELDQVVDDHAVAWRRGAPRLSHTAKFRELERMLLPLAKDGRNVDMLLNVCFFHL